MDDLHRPNGIVSAVDLLASHMRQRGLRVDLLCFGPCDEEFKESHHVITAMPGRRLSTEMAGYSRSKPALKPLRRAITPVWWPLAKARLRRIADTWEPGTLVVGAGLDSVRLLTQAGVRPAVLVSQVHADVLALTQQQRSLLRSAAESSCTITALTPEGAEELERWGLPSVFLANPAPEAREQADVEHSRTVVYIGRLARAKQVDHLIEAFAHVAPRDWKLRIYGAGPMEGELRAMVEGADADIELCGTVSDVAPVLNRAAIHALPSQAEGLAMSILEANMAGVPTIAYNATPGVRLAAGPSARLVALDDRRAFEEALSELMRDDAARARAGRQAREHGRAFSASAVVDQWMSLWGQLAPRAELAPAPR